MPPYHTPRPFSSLFIVFQLSKTLLRNPLFSNSLSCFGFPNHGNFPTWSSTREEADGGGTERVKKQRFKAMNWVQRKIYMYNVTFGMYMLDRWERYLFNTLVIILLWFVCYNGSRSAAEFYRRLSLELARNDC
ncbi:hypothetical protein NE237_022200 [Protea cynaroides]|uniref:Uncharacterized protein n=1 Tax=Protea cynaroides TaxID=273540 RepID=A0A9Q0HBL2_9MAGN|nr:hypothetical protein NE237_022200 [Protea cynaroides]